MLEVCHYSLTAWIFWLILAVLIVGVMAVILLLIILQKKPKRKRRQPKTKPESLPEKYQERIRQLEEEVEKLKSPVERQRKEKCVAGQYFGFLKDMARQMQSNFMVPENCLACEVKVACRGLSDRSRMERLWKKIVG